MGEHKAAAVAAAAAANGSNGATSPLRPTAETMVTRVEFADILTGAWPWVDAALAAEHFAEFAKRGGGDGSSECCSGCVCFCLRLPFVGEGGGASLDGRQGAFCPLRRVLRGFVLVGAALDLTEYCLALASVIPECDEDDRLDFAFDLFDRDNRSDSAHTPLPLPHRLTLIAGSYPPRTGV